MKTKIKISEEAKKQELIYDLKRNIKDLRALIKDINAWDIYNDENWEGIIKNLQEAIKYIKKE